MSKLAWSGLLLLLWNSSGGVMTRVTSSIIVKPKIGLKKPLGFDAQTFLDSAGVARKVVEYRKSEAIYSQGDPATGVKYIQKGAVKLLAERRSSRFWARVIFLARGAWQVSLFVSGRPRP